MTARDVPDVPETLTEPEKLTNENSGKKLLIDRTKQDPAPPKLKKPLCVFGKCLLIFFSFSDKSNKSQLCALNLSYLTFEDQAGEVRMDPGYEEGFH